MAVREIPEAEFVRDCLTLIEEVHFGGDEIIITKQGKPVARLLPADETGPLTRSVLWEKDLISPINEQWDAER